MINPTPWASRSAVLADRARQGAGELVFIAGQLATDKAGNLVGEQYLLEVQRWRRFEPRPLFVALLALAAPLALAQAYPQKPVRLIVPAPAGGPPTCRAGS